MIVYDRIDTISNRNVIVAVGSFDGVHLGHRFLIEKLNEEADKRGMEALIMTFNPGPKQYFGKSSQILSSREEQLILLQEAGARNVLSIPFTMELSTLSGRRFVHEILKEKLHVSAYVMGKNHYFGHDRKGGPESVNEEGIETVTVNLINDISSTAIRQLISNGELEKANGLLGGNGYLIKSPIENQAKLLPPSYRLYDAIVDNDKIKKVDINHLPNGIVRLLK